VPYLTSLQLQRGRESTTSRELAIFHRDIGNIRGFHNRLAPLDIMWVNADEIHRITVDLQLLRERRNCASGASENIKKRDFDQTVSKRAQAKTVT
jgi:hypothetical protein